MILTTVAVALGAIAASVLRRKAAIIAAGTTAWFGLLGALLYHEYFVPYQGGGASMWPIAQLFGGTFAAVVAAGAAAVVSSLRRDHG